MKSASIALDDLHDHAFEILRQVRGDQREYVVTQQGQPIARLLPLEQVSPTIKETRGWQRYLQIADELRRTWPACQSSQAVLDDVRR
jgi:prevent-host-death family protein